MKNMLKKIKTGYYYFFYTLYKFYKRGPSVWWSKGKAEVSIIALEIWLFGSIIFCYCLLTNTKLNVSFRDPSIVLPLILIFLLNYAFFNKTDEWKSYAKHFDQLPKQRNYIGGILVWSLIIIIVIIFFVSAYFYQKRVLGL